MTFRTANLVVSFIRVGKAEPLDIAAIVVSQTKQLLITRWTIRRADGELIAEATAQCFLQPWLKACIKTF
jgi:acyl-coenzyme A thioesterase PaaI-like protein